MNERKNSRNKLVILKQTLGKINLISRVYKCPETYFHANKIVNMLNKHLFDPYS